MRPVNRGNPASYPNYPTVAIPFEVQQSIDFLFSLMRNQRWTGSSIRQRLQAQIDGIIGDLKQNQDIDFVPDATLKAENWTLWELQEHEENLERQLDAAEGADEATLLGIAQKLVFVLQLEMAWYAAAVKPNKNRIAATYALARGDLINNIGQYCSYCEMPLAASLAVEHQLPKAWFPRVAVNWDNFLLACPICNSIKKDTPTLADGSAAINRVLIPKPTWTDLATAAFGLYLWPNDAATYPNFLAAFQYDLLLLLYNSDSSIFAERRLLPQQLSSLIMSRRLSLATPDESGYIKVTLLPQLFQLVGNDALAATIFLTQITTSQAIHSANVNGVPPILVQAFANALPTPEMISDHNQYLLTLGVAPNVTIEPRQPGEWRLAQRDYYLLTTAGRLTVRDLNSQHTFFQSSTRQAEITALLNSLGNNILPQAIAAALNIDNFARQISINQAGDGSTRNTYVIEAARNYRLRIENGIVSCYGEHTLAIELRLVGTTAQAALTIDKIKLNKNAPKDPKNADRRMSRRIRAYFAAIQSLYNLVDAQALDANLATVTLAMVKEQAISTGFWSVWIHVLSSYISDTSPHKVTVLNAINSGFVGTR